MDKETNMLWQFYKEEMEHRRQKKMSWMFNVQRETIKRSEIKGKPLHTL